MALEGAIIARGPGQRRELVSPSCFGRFLDEEFLRDLLKFPVDDAAIVRGSGFCSSLECSFDFMAGSVEPDGSIMAGSDFTDPGCGRRFEAREPAILRYATEAAFPDRETFDPPATDLNRIFRLVGDFSPPPKRFIMVKFRFALSLEPSLRSPAVVVMLVV